MPGSDAFALARRFVSAQVPIEEAPDGVEPTAWDSVTGALDEDQRRVDAGRAKCSVERDRLLDGNCRIVASVHDKEGGIDRIDVRDRAGEGRELDLLFDRAAETMVFGCRAIGIASSTFVEENEEVGRPVEVADRPNARELVEVVAEVPSSAGTP